MKLTLHHPERPDLALELEPHDLELVAAGLREQSIAHRRRCDELRGTDPAGARRELGDMTRTLVLANALNRVSIELALAEREQAKPYRCEHGRVIAETGCSECGVCSDPDGHSWKHTGTAYGGDDESYHGEGRVYCEHCGQDGDA